MLTRQLDFDVERLTIRNTVAPDIGLAVMTDIDDAAVFREELPHRMVSSNAAVFTEGYDNFVLEYSFGVNNDRLPESGWRSSRSELYCYGNGADELFRDRSSNTGERLTTMLCSVSVKSTNHVLAESNGFTALAYIADEFGIHYVGRD